MQKKTDIFPVECHVIVDEDFGTFLLIGESALCEKILCRRKRATLESDPSAPVNREGETHQALEDKHSRASRSGRDKSHSRLMLKKLAKKA